MSQPLLSQRCHSVSAVPFNTISTIAVTTLCSFSLSLHCADRCLPAVGFLLDIIDIPFIIIINTNIVLLLLLLLLLINIIIIIIIIIIVIDVRVSRQGCWCCCCCCCCCCSSSSSSSSSSSYYYYYYYYYCAILSSSFGSRNLETQHFPQFVGCSKDGQQQCTSNDVRNVQLSMPVFGVRCYCPKCTNHYWYYCHFRCSVDSLNFEC